VARSVVTTPAYVQDVTIPDRYAAFWIPGPDDLDMDEGLRLGYRWLDAAQFPGRRVVVLHAKKMLNNRPALAEAGRYTVVTPRGRGIAFGEAGAVLAVWPTPDALELGQQLALDGALCVIPYRHDITWWIARTGAANLADPDAEPPQLPDLDPQVRTTLDSMLQFGGHNGFLGGGEKEDAVADLRELVRAGHRPAPEQIEAYARASGETDVDGARRLRGFYESILAGRGLRDYRGRPI